MLGHLSSDVISSSRLQNIMCAPRIKRSMAPSLDEENEEISVVLAREGGQGGGGGGGRSQVVSWLLDTEIEVADQTC